MASLTPVTDPNILQQLNGQPLQPVDPNTAAQLDQLHMQSGSPDLGGMMDSPVGAVARGLRDVVDQGAAMATNAVSSVAPSGSALANWANSEKNYVAKINKNAEQDYEQNWLGGQPPTAGEVAGRIGGNILGTAPIAALVPGGAAAGLIPRIAAGAVSGAASGAFQPVDANDPNFWGKVGENAAIGGAGGAVMPAAIGAASRVINPTVSSDVQTLMQNGVRPTIGQMLGRSANSYEQAGTSAPFVRDFITHARSGAIEDFDRGAVNQALAPINQTLEAPGMNRQVIGEMNDKINDAYEALKPQLGWTTTSPAAQVLQNGMTTLRANVAVGLPKAQADIFNDDMDLLLNQRMSSGWGITGPSFQEAKSDIGKRAVDLQSNPNGNFWDKRLAGAYWQAQQVMRDAQNVANPAAGAQLTNVDNAFAHSLRVNNAATRLGGEPGTFSPPQLQAASKALDQTLRQGDFARGDALMQDYAEAGRRVLGNTVPDSGTPFRSAMMLLGGMGGAMIGGHEMGVPPSALLGLGGLGLASGLPYSNLGRSAVAHLLATRPGFAGPLANAVRATSPYGATAFAPLSLGGAPAGQ